MLNFLLQVEDALEDIKKQLHDMYRKGLLRGELSVEEQVELISGSNDLGETVTGAQHVIVSKHCGRHSHSGGDTYGRLLRPPFLASPLPKDPIYFYNLTQRPHIFSQNCVLSPKAPIFSEKLKF